MYSFNDEDENESDDELKDFNFGGKDALLFLIDCTEKMHTKAGPDEESPFEIAVGCVHATLKNKIFGSPKDYVGALLCGTREQVNVRNFENLSLLLPFDTPEGGSIRKLDEYLRNYPDKFDQDFGVGKLFRVHEALWQSQTLFNEVPGKTGSKKIILFTCQDNPHGSDERLKKQAIKKGGDILKSGVNLDVLPVGNPSFDFSKFYCDLLPSDYDFDVCPDQKFVDMLSLVKKRDYKKRVLARLPLDLGMSVQLAVSMYSFVQKASPPTKFKLSRDTNEEVRQNRQFINYDTGAPYLSSDISKYQEYKNMKIKFTKEQVKMLSSSTGPKGLRLLGFKDHSEIRWHQFVRHSQFIYPDEYSMKGSRNLFASLLYRCIDLNVVAICSFKPRDSAQCTFVALMPFKEKSRKDSQEVPKGFLIYHLPFYDDLRNVPEVDFVESTDEELELSNALLKCLKLRHYHVEDFENPALQSQFHLIESLALQDETIQETEDTTDPPLEKMTKKLGKVSQDLKDLFDLPDFSNAKLKNANRLQDESQGGPPAKKEKFSSMNDVEKMAKKGTVDKLTVVELKNVLGELGIPVVGKKKAALVEDVYKHFQSSN